MGKKRGKENYSDFMGNRMYDLPLFLYFFVLYLCDDTRQHPPSSSFHPSPVKLNTEAVVMATGRGSGNGLCIQHFTRRKVITELLLSMLRA